MKNWIITSQQDAINLDYVSKVMWGGDFPTSGDPATDAVRAKRLYIYHGGIGQTTGTKGSTTSYDYPDAFRAQAARDLICSILVGMGAAEDLRAPVVTLNAINPGATPAGFPNAITLDGLNITAGQVLVNGITVATVTTPDGIQFTPDASLPAGTYDVVYRDAAGRVAVLPGGLVLT